MTVLQDTLDDFRSVNCEIDRAEECSMYLVFFKGRDQDAINAAFREFSAKSVQKANKMSIHQKLLKNKNIAKQSKKDKVKEMHQTQER